MRDWKRVRERMSDLIWRARVTGSGACAQNQRQRQAAQQVSQSWRSYLPGYTSAILLRRWPFPFQKCETHLDLSCARIPASGGEDGKMDIHDWQRGSSEKLGSPISFRCTEKAAHSCIIQISLL